VKLTPEDCFVFQLSGGSTGVPKIIPRFHAEYLAHCDSWNRDARHGRRLVGSGACRSCKTPARSSVHGGDPLGPTTVLTSRIDIAHILDMIAKYRVTNAMSHRADRAAAVAVPGLAKHDLSSLRYFVASARRWIEAHLGVKAANLYGHHRGLVLIRIPTTRRARGIHAGTPGHTRRR